MPGGTWKRLHELLGGRCKNPATYTAGSSD